MAAHVAGRVFVNNVSMGLYAEAVQNKGYRNAKIRTLLDTVPAVFGPSGSELDLQWVSPDGAVHASAATILVSNNPYRLGHAVGSGTRPRIDAGRLGWRSSRPEPVATGTARRPSPAVVDRGVPGRLDTAARSAGYRRRGRRARPPDPVPDTSGHAARTDLPPTPRCVTLGDAARSLR